MDERNIPSRFRESNFRRFESHLSRVIASYPHPITFGPGELSQETFAARIRDAVTAYLKPDNLWESNVDRDRLRIVWRESEVRMVDDGLIEIGPRVARKGLDKISLNELKSSNTGSSVIDFDSCSPRELHAIATLLNTGKLVATFRLANPKFTEAHSVEVQETFPNVQMQQDTDNSWLIL